MRGSPLLHCILCALAFALFAVPLSRLTFARPKVADAVGLEPATKSNNEGRRIIIRIRWAHAPASLSLKLGGRELLPGPGRPISTLQSPLEAEASMPLTGDGLEFSLAARWPGGTPDTAVTVEIEPDEYGTRRETRWSSGARLDEILSFKW